MPASDYLAQQELNVHLGTILTPGANTYFALLSASPNGTTADALSKELSGTGYARVAQSRSGD